MKRSSNLASKAAEDARLQLHAILDAAAAERATVITRRGREVAAVVPVSAIKAARPVSLLTLAGRWSSLPGPGCCWRPAQKTVKIHIHPVLGRMQSAWHS